jgi:uncharacterized membrane protein YgdD (TMEM256/DUF423 family)
MKNKRLIQIAALFGAFAVGIGAFGAHGLSDILMQTGRMDTFETGVKYHFYHSLAMLIVGIWNYYKPNKNLERSFWSFCLGILIFSGSLYVLSLTGINILGAITPLGGVAFILGWFLIIRSANSLN